MNVINIDEKTDKAYVYSNIYSSGRVDLWNKTLDIFTKSNNYNKKFLDLGHIPTDTLSKKVCPTLYCMFCYQVD